MTRKILLSSALIVIFFSTPALAQGKASGPPAEKTPVKEWIDAENALIKPLSEKDKESFFILRNKYSVIRVVGIVERDVGNAVKSCGDNNPDMKDKMNTRFKQWKGAVDPIIDTAKKTWEKDMNAQTIVDAKEARHVLKLNDKAYEYGEKQIVKNPVSSKEACEGLLESMDDTEDKMVTLLQQTLLPESVIRTRGEKMDKERSQAKTAPQKQE